MEIKQAWQFVNTATQEVLGETALVAEDLSNIVDVGDSIQNALGTEKFYKSVVNQIGRMLFVTRPYRGKYASMFKDSWEFGSIVGKLQAELVDASENDAYQIVNGASYDPYVVNLPVVSSKFYNKAVTFELDITNPEDQIKQSFKSADEMMRFLSMIEVMVNNSMELKLEALAQRTINNFAGAIIDNNGANVIHLVTEYNGIAGTSLTAGTAVINADFLRYAVARMGDVKSYLREYSTIFNLGGKARHTPTDLLHVVVNSAFASRVKTHLQSVTYNEEFVKLPKYEEVGKWQGLGTAGSLTDRTTIKADVVLDDGTTKAVDKANIVCIMFDHDALGVLQPQKKVTSIYNPKGEYYNQFWKWVSRYFCDFNEQGAVFILD